MQQPIKILFDNSILKDNLINLFEQNHILDLKNNGLLSFYVSDMTFHENIIDLFYINDKKDFYKRIVSFLFRFSDFNFFKKLDDIILYELSNKKFVDKYFLYSQNIIKQFYIDFKNNNANWNKIITAHRTKTQININIYSEYKKIIQRIENEISKLQSNNDYDSYVENEINKDLILFKYKDIVLDSIKEFKGKNKVIKYLDWWAVMLLANQLGIKYDSNEIEILKNALTGDTQYLKEYLDIMTYCFTFRFENNSKKFDSKFNDNEYICLMKDLDILLSNDSNYMKHCFENVYQDTSKKILKPKEFIDYLKNINYI